MANLLAIKEEYKTTVVGFNGSGLPLGERKDLDKLALLAIATPYWGKYFVTPPTIDDVAAYIEAREKDLKKKAARDAKEREKKQTTGATATTEVTNTPASATTNGNEG